MEVLEHSRLRPTLKLYTLSALAAAEVAGAATVARTAHALRVVAAEHIQLRSLPALLRHMPTRSVRAALLLRLGLTPVTPVGIQLSERFVQLKAEAGAAREPQRELQRASLSAVLAVRQQVGLEMRKRPVTRDEPRNGYRAR